MIFISLKNTRVPTTTFKLSEISAFSDGNDLSDKINRFDFLSEVGLNLVSAEWLIDLRGVLFCSYQMCVNPMCFPLSYTHAVWCTDRDWGRLRARSEFTSLHKPTVQVNQALSALVHHCIIYKSIRRGIFFFWEVSAIGLVHPMLHFFSQQNYYAFFIDLAAKTDLVLWCWLMVTWHAGKQIQYLKQ